MENEKILYKHIESFIYNYINDLYIIEVQNNNNIELEEFEISMFIDDKYPIHINNLKEGLLIDIKKKYPNLLNLYVNKISVDIFEDENYNKGILYEKLCVKKLHKKNP